MSELSPSNKLDEVLKILFVNVSKTDSVVTKASITEHLKDKIPKHEIPLILSKLEKDGCINVNLDAYSYEVYTITFEGLVLHESGGYHNKNIISSQNETRIVRNDRWLIRGTWTAAVIGLLVLLWYVFLWYYPHHSDFVRQNNPVKLLPK